MRRCQCRCRRRCHLLLLLVSQARPRPKPAQDRRAGGRFARRPQLIRPPPWLWCARLRSAAAARTRTSATRPRRRPHPQTRPGNGPRRPPLAPWLQRKGRCRTPRRGGPVARSLRRQPPRLRLLRAPPRTIAHPERLETPTLPCPWPLRAPACVPAHGAGSRPARPPQPPQAPPRRSGDGAPPQRSAQGLAGATAAQRATPTLPSPAQRRGGGPRERRALRQRLLPSGRALPPAPQPRPCLLLGRAGRPLPPGLTARASEPCSRHEPLQPPSS
mmetsp:Transcript_4306/g.18201  ORF Transcript_4306/g.18201 Transcript_4306/m.18201 type:complete len:273 (-) Transcript_4306:29-847(-)